jgi:hypothetical protein
VAASYVAQFELARSAVKTREDALLGLAEAFADGSLVFGRLKDKHEPSPSATSRRRQVAVFRLVLYAFHGHPGRV